MRAAEAAAHTTELQAIVCETYTITMETLRKSRQTTALELIGALRWFAIQHGIPFVLQSPAEAKGFGTDAKLEKIGWLKPKAQDHANDAARHLLVYCVKNKIVEVPR